MSRPISRPSSDWKALRSALEAKRADPRQEQRQLKKEREKQRQLELERQRERDKDLGWER
jgi:hypothetical protein